MQQYIYTAKDHEGRIIRAEVGANNVSDASKLLITQNLFPLSINPRTTGVSSLAEIQNLFVRISTKDKVLFTRQLSTLVKAGLPLARALEVLKQQITNPKLLRMVQEISASIEGGSSLSQSLAKYPDLFNHIYISMVEAGEASGNLDDTLLRLAAQEEKNQSINSKIRGAFTYPIVVLVVLVAVAVLMITLVLPQVGGMYTSLNKPLPFFTKILLGFASILTHFWYLFILALIGGVYALRLYLKSPPGRATLDQAKLSTPIMGVLFRKVYMARFSRTLGSLITTGVPVLQALAIVARSINNVHLEKEITDIATKVKAGTAMSKPVSESPLFLPMVGQMLGVGEETGTIGDSLNKVAQYYEDEVDEAVKNISTLIEPATMVVLGGMVAFLIAAVLLPIYGLVTQISG